MLFLEQSTSASLLSKRTGSTLVRKRPDMTEKVFIGRRDPA